MDFFQNKGLFAEIIRKINKFCSFFLRSFGFFLEKTAKLTLQQDSINPCMILPLTNFELTENVVSLIYKQIKK